MFVTASDDKTVRLWDVASKVDKIFVMINTIGTIIRKCAVVFIACIFFSSCWLRIVSYAKCGAPF